MHDLTRDEKLAAGVLALVLLCVLMRVVFGI